MRVQPNPSAVIAAEFAFNRLAREKGQWTAFRETAAKDAVMFVPERVMARDWLKGRADPPRSVEWTPHRVYVSCDGRLAASTGGWTRPDGSVGYFTTIWRLDKKGRWEWIMDHGDALSTAREAPEFLVGKVATCCRGGGPGAAERAGDDKAAPPPDDSLVWTVQVAPDKGRHIVVRMWTGQDYENVIDDRVAAP
nr:hypothetical protein [Sphingobium fontiphilum]